MTGSGFGHGCLILWLLLTALGCETPEPLPAAVTWTEPVTGIELVRLEGGRFLMGTPEAEPLREPQEIRHPVTLSGAFFIARHEVTQEQWQRVMGGNPSFFQNCGGDCPVETVSALDIERFLDRLEVAGGHRLRLPTEAEWEFACRAGSAAAFTWGDTLQPDQAQFDGSDPYPGARRGPVPRTPVAVGSFAPNGWGLYDFHGNLWEWTQDEHCPYPRGAVTDPVGDCDSELLVIRGGAWNYGADSARCGLRYTHRPQDDGPGLGFRLAMDAE
ncbi:MAG: formylglycine-generating enzyme family protein [Acidobacteriota bacterium]